jgi:hypothetical protein
MQTLRSLKREGHLNYKHWVKNRIKTRGTTQQLSQAIEAVYSFHARLIARMMTYYPRHTGF